MKLADHDDDKTFIKVKKNTAEKNKMILELLLRKQKNVYLNQSAAHLTSYLPHKRPARRKNYNKKKHFSLYSEYLLLHSKYFYFIQILSLHSIYFSLHSK